MTAVTDYEPSPEMVARVLRYERLRRYVPFTHDEAWELSAGYDIGAPFTAPPSVVALWPVEQEK